jgi:16S rRNA (cytosine967-C5)-methyltransferase
MFAVWAVLEAIQFRLAPTEHLKEKKGRFDELSKVRALKESIPDWMDELGVKN